FGRPLPLMAFAACTVRDAGAISAGVVTALVHFGLAGGRLPAWLLFQAVKRNRAEHRVTWPRAALIKMVLLSKDDSASPLTKENRMVQLNTDDAILNDPRKKRAYYCGRLLAVLERTQRAALGNQNTTMVGRFYSVASSAPASVFGRLMRLNGAHLEKLRKSRPGAYAALHARIQDITHPHLPIFPHTLNLEEQGLFGLGYYHQHAHERGEA